MLDTRQLRYFAAIRDHGSLSRAAAELRVAVSALSHHLSQLETQLDIPLFIRKARGMEPTAAGLRLYDHARSILKAIEAAETDLRESGAKIGGPVAVGMSFSAVKAVGLQFLTRVLTDYPAIKLALTESLSGAALPFLMASDVDMALVYNPPSDTGLRSVPVLEETLLCAGRPEIIGTPGQPITFAEILELPVILLRQGVSARAIVDDVQLLKKLEARARLQMNSVQAIAGALEAGLGCVIGTHLFLGDQLARGVVVTRPIIEPEMSRVLYLCNLAARPPTYATEAVRTLLLDLIRDAIGNGTWNARLLLD